VNITNFLKKISTDERFLNDIVHFETLPPSSARLGELEPPLDTHIQEALNKQKVKRLYQHQVDAVQSARNGLNVVTVTPTASGKTLVYTLPIIEKVISDPGTFALLIFPLKALAQDQLKSINLLTESLEFEHPVAAIFDGDTPKNERVKLKKRPPHLLLTNPDMLHHGMLPYHSQWAEFFRGLKYVVIDEIHTYKGIFGSHVLQIIRRLKRIANFHHTSIQFLATSATIANPKELAENLTGEEFTLVEKSGAPASRRHIVFVNPTASTYTVAVKLFTAAMEAGLKTIVFSKARKITELVYQWTVQSNPSLAGKISSYRAGYLPKERREIEKNLKSGKLKGVISTSALEMGIDIGGLDVCILIGYPGTITNTWQRAGRVGRGTNESAVFLIAQHDALDQYFMKYPEDFFGRSAEAAVVDRSNRYLLRDHLACAAQEVPIRKNDTIYPVDTYRKILDELTEESILVEAAQGTVWFSKRKNPQREINIRAAGPTFPIFEMGTRKLIGHVNGFQAMTECHPGAVYLHHGKTYVVDKLDLGTAEVTVHQDNVKYYTISRTEKETEILEIRQSRDAGRYKVDLGLVEVTEKVIGYEKRYAASREKVSEHELDLPPVKYKTIGLWIQPCSDTIDGLSDLKYHVMGSLHATEHASLALLPLFALCDRNDVGGISFTKHPQLEGAAVFLYDGHPGGVGLSTKAFDVLDELLEKVLTLVEGCDCEEGCPSCIHSPKCGHGNIPLDKIGCIRLLKHLTGKEEIKPLHSDIEDSTGAKPDKTQEVKSKKKLSSDLKIIDKNKDIPKKSYVSKLPVTEGRDIVVFDIETQLSAEDVGGWHNSHLMRVSLAVLFERQTGQYFTYFEDDIQELIRRLNRAELVVGFNSKRFDYAVLSAYSGEDLLSLPSLDLLSEIVNQHGHRVKLDSLGTATLKSPKSADGLMALKWWKEGKLDKIEKYCKKDVEITARLLDYALEHGYLLVNHKSHGIVRLLLDLPVERLLT